MMYMFILAFAVAFGFYLYTVYSRFSRYGVKNFLPVPMIGTIFKFLFKMEHVTEEYTALRKRFPYDRFVGKFIALTPIVVVFDPEVIKRILVKDFHHFRHRTFGKQKEKDDLQGSSLFFLADYQEWKPMRRTMIQSFTSAQINGHVPKLRKVGQKIVNNLREALKSSKDNFIDIEARNIVVEFVLRSVASCVLDLDFENDADFRLFHKKTLTVSMFKFSAMIKMFFLNNYPKLTDYIKLRLYPESTKRYFRKLLTELMDERETSSVTKPDILQVLVNARKDWPDDYLIAQLILILDPARDTVTEAASCLLYELVMHPEVLDRLVQEIDEHAAKYGGNLEALHEITYLEMVILAFAVAFGFYLYTVYSRFSRYGVKNFLPVPMIGTIFKFLFKMEHVTEEYTALRKRFPYDRFVGKFIALTPIVVVFDPEVIKRILVKDFHHFRHRTFGKQKEKDDLQGSSLFFLADYQEWKPMRRTMIQSFTSAQINGHVPKLRKVGQKIVNNLREALKSSKDNFIDIEARNIVVEFVLRSVASCVLDLDFENDADFRLFHKKTLTVSMFKFSAMIKMFFLNNYPKLTDYIKLRLYPESTKRYFRKLLTELMDERETSSVTKPDILQVLVNARKDWPDDYLIAQLILILDPARDTVTEAASCLLYELVMHPEVLDRLVQEIDEHAAKYGGNLEALHEITYLEMVILETLRLWPPSPLVDRTCTIDYNLGTPNNRSSKDYIIKNGEHLHIPVSVIHRDPRNFPDPLKFDPERFSEENRKTINPFIYMPFGGGRRICPGARLAICQIKVLTIELLRNLELSSAPNTPKVAKLSRRSVLMELEHCIRIRERRK